MKKIIFLTVMITLLFSPFYEAFSQNQTASTTTTSIFSSSSMPQWVKDMRRFDIITFGVFPFSMFTVTFISDMVKWNQKSGMSFTEEAMRYAPWPLKTAGAPEMTNEDITRTIVIALGVSAAVACIDLLIVKIKRYNERRRLESRPTGSIIIEKSPYGEFDEGEDPNKQDGILDGVLSGEESGEFVKPAVE